MRKPFVRTLSLLGLLACLGGVALPSGYALNEQGTRAMAQANAFTARASDPSALFFNPAGIARFDRPQFYMGGTMFIQESTWTSPDGATSFSSNDKTEAAPHAMFTMPVGNNWHMGIGVYAPFGLSKRWDASFSGRYSARYTELKAIYITPTLAYRLNDSVSIGGGVSLVNANARLDRNLNLKPLSSQISIPDAYFSASGDDRAFGWNAGIQIALAPEVFFGANYRSSVKLDFDGKLNIDLPHTNVPQLDQTLAVLFPSQNMKTSLTLPDSAQFGIGGRITRKLEGEIDLQWTDWSDYHDLPFIFSKETAALHNSLSPKYWKDGWVIRTGGEYKLTPAHALRFGGYYEFNPQPQSTMDPSLPDSSRLSFSGGYGWTGKHFFADAAYMIIRFNPKDFQTDPAYRIIPAAGKYTGTAHLLGISVGYRF